MAFAVVQFMETDEVAIISSSWLTDETTCKWPPYEDKMLIKRAVLEKRAPENNWENHSIFIIGVHKTYAGAKKEADKALQSDSDSNDKTPEITRQKIQSVLQNSNSQASTLPTVVVIKKECLDSSSSSELVLVPDSSVSLMLAEQTSASPAATPRPERFGTPVSCQQDSLSENMEECQPNEESEAEISTDESIHTVILPKGSSSTTEVFESSTYSFACIPDLSHLIPERLPRAIEAAISKKQFNQSQRSVVVRAIADRCYAANIPTHMIDFVADLAVEKWSPLKSEYGPKSKPLALQIKRRMAKLKSPKLSRKKQEQAIEETEAHDLAMILMQKEMQKKTPSTTKLKDYLNAIRKVRIVKAAQTSAAKHLAEYPAFKIQDLLIYEFSSIMKITEDELESNWKSCLDSMSRYLEGTENSIPPECVSYDLKTVHILLILPSLLRSGKRTKERTKFVLEIFEQGTLLHTILPAANEPPRLIGIGNQYDPDIELACYVDGTPLFVAKPVKALLLLLGTFLVFGIKFPTEARPSFLFIAAVLLKHRYKSAELQKTAAVVGLLKQLRL